MRTLIILILITSSTIGYAQNDEVKLAAKVAYSLTADIIINSPKIKIGADFQTKNNDLYLYLTYDFMRQSLYRGHYLGISLENHFLSKEKRLRPYFGLSILTELATNYKEGFLSADIDDGTYFLTSDSHAKYPVFYGQSSYYIFNSSGFYYSTPFFGTASLGFDLRLIKDLHLNFSLGYGLQIMRYKYLEWKNDADYRELLKNKPMKSKMLHYINAELGLRYEFSFGKR